MESTIVIFEKLEFHNVSINIMKSDILSANQIKVTYWEKSIDEISDSLKKILELGGHEHGIKYYYDNKKLYEQANAKTLHESKTIHELFAEQGINIDGVWCG